MTLYCIINEFLLFLLFKSVSAENCLITWSASLVASFYAPFLVQLCWEVQPLAQLSLGFHWSSPLTE